MGIPETRVVELLDGLSERDFLVYHADAGQVVALYPFSDKPCPHRVTLKGKDTLYAM